jgi:hypothetical protein
VARNGIGVAGCFDCLAIAQMGVHLVFFLHITARPDNVMALAFGVLIVLLLLAGAAAGLAAAFDLLRLDGRALVSHHGAAAMPAPDRSTIQKHGGVDALFGAHQPGGE